MSRRKILRAIATFAIIAAITITSTLSVCAATTTDSGTGTVTGSVGINGSIIPLTISVTHQVTLSYTIDPNAGTITAAPITITNNTKCPVNVQVQSLASTTGGSLSFTDVLPTAKTWASLNEADSQKYIALGINIASGTGWNTGFTSTTDWAAANTPTLFGSLASGATGNLQLVADYGFAFTSSFTANSSIVLVVSLV